jgi:hypothetical protein
LTNLTSDSDCTGITGGSIVTFVIHMNIGAGGVSGTNFARAGELSFDYKSK